jgi:hypothetical protein
MASEPLDVGDPQDQSEVFDEDNQELDDAGSSKADMKTLEEIPDVFDVTSAVGDADDDAGLISEDLDDQEVIELEDDAELVDFEDDDLAARMPEELRADDGGEDNPQDVLLAEESGLDAADRELTATRLGEASLVYAGELDDVAQEDANPSEFEVENLADDDIADLGYGTQSEPGDPDTDGHPGAATMFDIILRNGVWVLSRDDQHLHDYGHADRAVHEAASLARELRRTGQPAVVRLQTGDGRLIEVTDDDPPPAMAEDERSAVIPDRSPNA